MTVNSAETLQTFDDEPIIVRRGQNAALVTLRTETPQVQVSANVVASESRSYLMVDPAKWDWSDVRDYVIAEIEVRFGTQPRDAKKEASIFRRFCTQWGEQAGLIAKHAFEVCDGWWQNSRITPNRFCKASDQYFAAVIADRLNQRS